MRVPVPASSRCSPLESWLPAVPAVVAAPTWSPARSISRWRPGRDVYRGSDHSRGQGGGPGRQRGQGDHSSASVTLTLIGAGTLGRHRHPARRGRGGDIHRPDVDPRRELSAHCSLGGTCQGYHRSIRGYDPPPAPDSIEVFVGSAANAIVFKSAQNGSFSPAVDEVAIGGKVHWTWLGSSSHSVRPLGLQVSHRARSRRRRSRTSSCSPTRVRIGTIAPFMAPG